MHFISGVVVGIVKISEAMHENLRVASNALSRSINAQAEHWMRIGMLAELLPDLDHSDICRLLIRAEKVGGLDLQQVCALAEGSQVTQVHVAQGAEQ
nr:ParD-like family protein [Pseudomonas sp. TH31]